jgi:hypothetical protein
MRDYLQHSLKPDVYILNCENVILGTTITIEFKLLGCYIYEQVKVKVEANGEMGYNSTHS